MRRALLASLMAAAFPVAAWALTAEELAREAGEMAIAPLPGEYRVTLDLLDFDAPGVSRATERQLRAVFAEGLAEDNTVCVGRQDEAGQAGLRLLEDLAEGDCDVDSFEVAGEAIDADMQCRYDDAVSHVTLAARIAPESSEAVLTLDRDLGAAGTVAATIRATAERVAECTA